MGRPQASFAKRQREQAKRERQQLKAERKAERKTDGTDDIEEQVVRETPITDEVIPGAGTGSNTP